MSEIRRLYGQALALWSLEAQIDMMIEECSELTVALSLASLYDRKEIVELLKALGARE